MDELVRIRILCEVAGISVDNEDIDLLAALFENQQQVSEALLVFDTQDLEPITAFDPRWQ